MAPPETTDTIPPAEVCARDRKKQAEDGPQKGFSHLVVEVFVMFHETIMPEPSFIRSQEPIDAAKLLAMLGSSSTKYNKLKRFYAIKPFSIEAVHGVTHKCVRYL